MSQDLLVSVLSILLIVPLFIMLFYNYGKRKGGEEIVRQPNMVYASLPDVTILGAYRIRKQSAELLTQTLNGCLAVSGFVASWLPNFVTIQRVLEPEEAAKKKDHFDKLRLMRDGFPDELTLRLFKSADSEDFLEVEARCLPVMYYKLAQGVQYMFPQSSVEDAQGKCGDFIENVMRMLDADVLIKPHTEASVHRIHHFDFIYNTPSQNDINDKAHTLIVNSSKQVLLVGWVDREFIGELENAKARRVTIKVITKSPEASDKTIKEDFERLLHAFGKDSVKLNPRTHDRFLLCDNTCIIGSPYFTQSSKTRYESAICTDDENVVKELASHFERIWKSESSKNPSR